MLEFKGENGMKGSVYFPNRELSTESRLSHYGIQYYNSNKAVEQTRFRQCYELELRFAREPSRR